MDAIEFLKAYRGVGVQVIILDPPHQELESHRARGTTVRLKQWFPTIPPTVYPDLAEACANVAADEAHCYIIYTYAGHQVIRDAFERAGWVFRRALIWDKQRVGMGYYYRSSYELILLFTRNKKTRPINDRSLTDILSFKSIRRGYPTEKPVELIQTLIEQSSNVRELVCDPFAGSGVSVRAATNSGRTVIAADIDIGEIAKRFCNEMSDT